MKRIDVLIAGAGLAGMTLAMELHRLGISFAIADRPRPRTASRVSAGIINPVPGRRFAPTWNADEIIGEAVNFWQEYGYLISGEILSPIQIYHFFHNDDQNYWNGRKHIANRFIHGEFSPNENFEGLRNEEGGVVISGYRVDISTFLQYSSKYLQDAGVTFIEESILIEDCESSGDTIIWRDTISANCIAWCEGWRSAINPLWSHLPFIPAKGEILTIKADKLRLPGVASRAIFIIPTSEPGVFRVGSTYKWNFADEEPTVDGREEISSALDKWIDAPYTLLHHDAGVRPATRDLKPIIGYNNRSNKHLIFNGLGAKGTLLAPYCARRLAAMIAHGGDCEAAIDATRFT